METTVVPQCYNCKARSKTVFAGCDLAILQGQSETKIYKHFNALEVVFSENEPSDGVYCVFEGTVALHKQPDDGRRAMMMHECDEGAILGVEGVVNNSIRQTTAQTLTATGACFIPKEAFLDSVSKDARVASNVMQRLCETIRRMGLARGREKLFCE